MSGGTGTGRPDQERAGDLFEHAPRQREQRGRERPAGTAGELLVAHADGSIDLHLGAKAPPGKEKNWMAMVPGRGFFAIIRLYSPTEVAFDASWKPSDLEVTTP